MSPAIQTEPDAHITVRDLTMAYGDFVIQRDLDFVIRRSDIFIIMGGSGCGKSTLMRHLLGLEEPAQIERDPLRGALYENLLIMEVVKNTLNQGKEPQLYFFRDSKGNEVDLLVSSAGRSFTAIEMKSATTFQPEFTKGIKVFRQSVGENIDVRSLLWYNGQRKTTYQSTVVSNPLLHGFSCAPEPKSEAQNPR